ncbi:MAG: hypothetical protein IT208_11640 [Chthonomonadales bacterium]|nr:hypothetical protein [Chthonomonadales bacterium]
MPFTVAMARAYQQHISRALAVRLAIAVGASLGLMLLLLPPGYRMAAALGALGVALYQGLLLARDAAAPWTYQMDDRRLAVVRPGRGPGRAVVLVRDVPAALRDVRITHWRSTPALLLVLEGATGVPVVYEREERDKVLGLVLPYLEELAALPPPRSGGSA